MKIIIRVDASVWIGSGHVMRCLVIAEKLKTAGFEITFCCLPQKGDLISFIKNRNFNVISLSFPKLEYTPISDKDYTGWLRRSIDEDVADFISHFESTDIVITDHYAIGSEWQEQIRAHFNCKIVAIDDLVRTHDADLIIDQTLGRKANEYNNLSNVLTGSKYAILNPRFSELRPHSYYRCIDKSKVKILISMGAIDRFNLTLKVMKALSKKDNFLMTVLLGKSSPHFSDVVSYCTKHQKIKHIEFTNDMAELMLGHDLAIGAPGTTSWERCCLGLPSILIPLAENQKDNCKALVNANAVIKVERNDIEFKLLPSVELLLNEYKEYHKNNMNICDGLGVNRVAEAITKLIKHSVKLRRATSLDTELTYKWQSQPNIRKYFKNTNIPTYSEHSAWMESTIVSKDVELFIVSDGSNDVGSVRIDKEPNVTTATISILIAPEYHGKGYAKLALGKIKCLFPDYILKAFVHKDNKPSQYLFEKSGFLRIDETTFKWEQ